MATENPILIDLPMPIRTPRLLIRPKQLGDGALAAAAVAETWDDLHQWVRWAKDLNSFTSEHMELRNRQVMARCLLREGIELLGIEIATSQAVVWSGFHDMDWEARQCDMGYWVRKSAQGAAASRQRQRTACCTMPSVRLECVGSGSRTQVAVMAAAALPRSLALPLKGFSGQPTCYPEGESRTGFAMLVSIRMVCRAWTSDGACSKDQLRDRLATS